MLAWLRRPDLRLGCPMKRFKTWLAVKALNALTTLLRGLTALIQRR